LRAFGDSVGVGIDQARLLETALEKERMQKEFDVARNIQASLLPRKPIMSSCCDIDAVMIPAAQVGGDYFDYIRFGNGNLGVIIADVAGKGVPAALYMATLKGVVLAEMRIATGPADLLRRVNEVLYGSMERRTYITMMAVEFSEDDRWLKVARAGHTPAIMRLNGAIRVVTPKGVAIGIVKPEAFNELLDEEEVAIGPGDLCLLTTDGVNERRNDKLVEMSLEPLTDMMSAAQGINGKELVRRTLEVLDHHGRGTDQHDDITIVGLSMMDERETESEENRMASIAGETL
jgi:phosphoserine phosphatase RsbU/P